MVVAAWLWKEPMSCVPLPKPSICPPPLLSSWGMNNGYGNDSLLHSREPDTGVSSYGIASLGSLM